MSGAVTCEPIFGPMSAVRELRPRRGWQPINLRELWRYRGLFWFLALRDVQVRYKQTALGALWAVLQPLAMMVVLSYVLRRLGQQHLSDPVFLYAGLLPWTFFAAAVVASTHSLVASADMLRKIYFPRLLVPIAAVGAPLLDLAIASVVLAGMMAWRGIGISGQMALAPLMLLTAIVAAMGAGILFAGLSVAYRDFRYVVPLLVSVGFFISGVMYDAGDAHWLWHVNPMSGAILGLRAAVLGHTIDWTAWAISTASAAALLIAGLTYFARTQRRFADIV